MAYVSFLSLTSEFLFQEMDYINQLNINSNKRILLVYHKIESILLVLKHFDRVFCLHPFLWLVYTFMSVSIMVTHIQAKKQFAFVGIFALFGHNSCIIIVLVVLHGIQRRFQRKLLLIESNLFTNKDLQQLPVLMTSLQSRIQCIGNWNMTAWTLFPLDIQLILSFITHLMTFTIMFVNLMK